MPDKIRVAMETPRSLDNDSYHEPMLIPNCSQIILGKVTKLGVHCFDASAEVTTDQVGEGLESPS